MIYGLVESTNDKLLIRDVCKTVFSIILAGPTVISGYDLDVCVFVVADIGHIAITSRFSKI